MLIADRPDLLSPAWLTDVLRTSMALDGASVRDTAMTPVGTGQMCDSVRVELTFDRPTRPEVPASLIAKLPADDQQSRATGKALRSYEAEVRFYQELAPNLPIRTPRAYYADIDLDTASFVLLLEDLAPALPGDQLAGCSIERATLALDELVGLHAPRWGDPALSKLDWLVRDPDASRAFLQLMVPDFWDGFRQRYAGRLGDEVHEVGGALIDGLSRFIERAPTGEATIVHGDYRLDNLLFGGEVGVAVLDWQTVAHGRALNDVAYFIGAGLLPEERRTHEADLVRRYHDALGRAGVDGYVWDQCWEDYRRGTFAGLLMAVAASMLVEQTPRGDDMFMTMAHRHATHALDLDAPALLT